MKDGVVKGTAEAQAAAPLADQAAQALADRAASGITQAVIKKL